MPDFLILQVIGFIVLVGVLAIIIQNIRKEKSIFTGIIILILLVMIAIIITPFQAAELLRSIGFARPLDAFIIMLTGISLLLALKMFIDQKRIQKQITKIVKKIAVQE